LAETVGSAEIKKFLTHQTEPPKGLSRHQAPFVSMLAEYWKKIIDEKFEQVFSTDPIQRNKHFRLNILVYEIGDLVKTVVYEEIFGNGSPETRRACYGERKKALSDAMMQLLIFARNENYNYDELFKIGLDGIDDFLERQKKSGVK